MNPRKIALIVLILYLGTAALFAGDKPLSLESSSPADGTTGVPLDQQILLVFSNNVVNMKVSERNAACFTLLNGRGEEVEMEVYFPDDQLEPENKRNITLIPAGSLEKNTTYTVVISPEVTAKNGAVLGEEVRLSFQTAR